MQSFFLCCWNCDVVCVSVWHWAAFRVSKKKKKKSVHKWKAATSLLETGVGAAAEVIVAGKALRLWPYHRLPTWATLHLNTKTHKALLFNEVLTWLKMTSFSQLRRVEECKMKSILFGDNNTVDRCDLETRWRCLVTRCATAEIDPDLWPMWPGTVKKEEAIGPYVGKSRNIPPQNTWRAGKTQVATLEIITKTTTQRQPTLMNVSETKQPKYKLNLKTEE